MVTWYAYGPKILVLKHGIWLVKLWPNELEPPFIHYFPIVFFFFFNRVDLYKENSKNKGQRDDLGDKKLFSLSRIPTNLFTHKVPMAANCKDVCLQNTSKSHSYHLKTWYLL